MRSNPAQKARSRGGALLAVLWLSAALSAIAFSVATRVRSETDRVSNTADGLRAQYLATGAVDRGIQWMLWGGQYRNPDGTARFWDFGQPRMYMRFPGGDAVVEVIPESSKLNINQASPEDLYRLLMVISGDPERSREIVAGIVDWRSAAPGPTPFDQYYLSFSPTFRARHASFQEIEELLLVRGMTPELFYGNYVSDDTGRLFARGGLRDCLSPWGSTADFDINTVSPALMEAFGTPQEAVAAIVARRTVRPFRNMNEIREITTVLPRLGFNSLQTVWTLRASARIRRQDGSGSDVVRVAGATVEMFNTAQSATPLQVLRWFDDAWSQYVIPPPENNPAVLPAAPKPLVPAENANSGTSAQ